MTKVYRILIIQPEGERLLGIAKHKWEDCKEIGNEDEGWIHLAEDKDHRWTLANMFMKCCIS
jgi:hypothetical protein